MGRRPFALSNARPQYAPDRPADIQHIALDLRFDFKERILFGVCRTTLQAVGRPLRSLEMDSAQLVIHSVRTAAGKKLAFESVGGKLRIDIAPALPARKAMTIVIGYEARKPRQGVYFVRPDSGYPDKPVQVWTQGQDQDAHYWFPCIDYPNAKATTEVTATVPSGYFVLSNGSLVNKSTDNRAKTTTFHWRQETPHVTYLVSCVAGRFAGHSDDVDGLPVSYYVAPGREADGARSFGSTPKMLRFFSRRIGVPYPYAKYAQIAVADFIFGGMENTSATTQTDTTLHDARAHLDFSSNSLVAHELAHQWFGDLLTCKDWSHAWLNEGFATYFDALFREHDLGEAEFDYYRLQLAARYFEEDRERYRRAIVTNVYAEPIDLFDRHLYEKAALVLHMVRRMLGEELWWAAVHRYVDDNRGKTVETIDLVRAIETVSGRNLRAFFDQWVFKAGHPELTVTYAWDADASSTRVTIAQKQELNESTPLFSLGLSLAFGFARGPEVQHRVDVTHAEQTFSFALERKPDVFYFDPDGEVLKTLDLRVPREMLIRQVQGERHLLARIDAIRALAQEASVDAVDTLEGVLAGRAFWGVKAQAAAGLAKIRSERAFDALVKARGVEHPKARRAVADALGSYHTDAACAALTPLLRKDESYFVEAAAAAAIGKTKAKAAFELLRKALDKESWNDVVRAAAFRGFGALGDERAIKLCVEWSAYGKPAHARDAAIEALGKLGQGKKDVRERLLELIDDPDYHTRMAALSALEELHEAAAIPRLEQLAGQDIDGRLKRRCAEVVRAIREYLEKPAEIKQLRDEVDALRETNKGLLDRLERLEAKSKPRATARS